jgi:esterase/lipase superfamily enzyme
MIDALAPLLDAGRIKIYSCDSVPGKALLAREGTPATRCGCRASSTTTCATRSCRRFAPTASSPDARDLGAGASIGAFHAVALVCRFPDVFSARSG